MWRPPMFTTFSLLVLGIVLFKYCDCICPPNHYLSGNIRCLKCPPNSHSIQGSHSPRQCLCDEGFQGPPGGPCQPAHCMQLAAPLHGQKSPCGNTVGDSCAFSCDDGYVVTRGSTRRTCLSTGEWDGSQTICEHEKQCRYLTVDDAPVNGRLFCTWRHSKNEQICAIVCNPGFIRAESPNKYEICGPGTGFVWSFQLHGDQKISPCVEDFFGIRSKSTRRERRAVGADTVVIQGRSTQP